MEEHNCGFATVPAVGKDAMLRFAANERDVYESGVPIIAFDAVLMRSSSTHGATIIWHSRPAINSLFL